MQRRFLYSLVYLYRVRYAPSPTGNMHLGGLRTAFYNYLFARKQNGTFILRIQDTDQARNQPESIENILGTLKWAGISIDQGYSVGGKYEPYIQSERSEIYRNFELKLLKQGTAYPCFCSYTNKKGEGSAYDGTCRNRNNNQIMQKLKNGEKYAVRIKSDLFSPQLSFKDEIYGTVTSTEFDDFVIVKQDRTPTYHFANVIDDIMMRITHVIRGQQWLTNTSKHIYLYKVFGVKPPIFCHIPLIQSPTGKKLAKRDPESSLQSLKTLDIQHQSLVNYLFRLGCSAPNNDILTSSQLIQTFSLQNISKSPIKFDAKLLSSLNKRVIISKWNKPELQNQFLNRVSEHVPELKSVEQMKKITFINSTIERVKYMHDFTTYRYYFYAPNYSQKQLVKLYGNSAVFEGTKIMPTGKSPELFEKNTKILQNLLLILNHLLKKNDQLDEKQLGMRISEYLDSNRLLKNEDVYHLLRFALTGNVSGPSVIGVCTYIGKQQITNRINALLGYQSSTISQSTLI